ncbi:hypothetical protein P4487_01095, partial [Bacillus subtilis]|nr:hypothetical protein [Bacillus subtilis]
SIATPFTTQYYHNRKVIQEDFYPKLWEVGERVFPLLIISKMVFFLNRGSSNFKMRGNFSA